MENYILNKKIKEYIEKNNLKVIEKIQDKKVNQFKVIQLKLYDNYNHFEFVKNFEK